MYLCYFKSESDSAKLGPDGCLGEIDLNEIQSVAMRNDKGEGRFDVAVPGRIYALKCEEGNEIKLKWVAALQSLLPRTQEYKGVVGDMVQDTPAEAMRRLAEASCQGANSSFVVDQAAQTLELMEQGSAFLRYYHDPRTQKTTREIVQAFWQKDATPLGSIYTSEPGEKTFNVKNALALHSLTDLYLGKQNAAFLSPLAAHASNERVFTAIGKTPLGADIELNLEADSKEQTASWLMGINAILTQKGGRKLVNAEESRRQQEEEAAEAARRKAEEEAAAAAARAQKEKEEAEKAAAAAAEPSTSTSTTADDDEDAAPGVVRIRRKKGHASSSSISVNNAPTPTHAASTATAATAVAAPEPVAEAPAEAAAEPEQQEEEEKPKEEEENKQEPEAVVEQPAEPAAEKAEEETPAPAAETVPAAAEPEPAAASPSESSTPAAAAFSPSSTTSSAQVAPAAASPAAAAATPAPAPALAAAEPDSAKDPIIHDFLSRLGAAYLSYYQTFVDNGVDREFLLTLNIDDLEELGIKNIHRKRMMEEVRRVRMRNKAEKQATIKAGAFAALQKAATTESTTSSSSSSSSAAASSSTDAAAKPAAPPAAVNSTAPTTTMAATTTDAFAAFGASRDRSATTGGAYLRNANGNGKAAEPNPTMDNILKAIQEAKQKKAQQQQDGVGAELPESVDMEGMSIQAIAARMAAQREAKAKAQSSSLPPTVSE